MNLIEALSILRKGKLVTEAQEKLHALVKACSETGKKGKLVITVTVGAAEDSTVALTGKVSSQLPEPASASTIFYADDNGSLYREDPRQPELPEIARMDQAASE